MQSWGTSGAKLLVLAAIGAVLLLVAATRHGVSFRSLPLLPRQEGAEAVHTWQDPMPWPAMLTAEEMARAIGYYGSGKRLHGVASKLIAGQPIKVALLGGSVTVGVGASAPANSYPRRFAQLLNATFPHRNHTFLYRGIAASSSSVFAACLDQLVPPDTDLVTLELDINEDVNLPITGLGRRHYEQLLRKLQHGQAAVVILHHYVFNWPRPAEPGIGSAEGVFWWPTEMHHSTLGRFYDIPCVSIAAGVYHLMAAAVEGFKTDKYVRTTVKANRPNADEREQASFYYADQGHPGDQGHKVLAEALAAPLLRAVGEVQAAQLLPPATLHALLLPSPHVENGNNYSRFDPRLLKIPSPMIPGNVEKRTLMCVFEDDVKNVVAKTSGFQYRAEWPNATDHARRKWGWSAYNPGDWFELDLDTRAKKESSSAADPPIVVAISFLHSYQHMGVAEAKCVSGCECSGTRLDGTWHYKLSLFQFESFQVTQHKQCRIRVTILDQPGQVPSGEHKFVMNTLVVRED